MPVSNTPNICPAVLTSLTDNIINNSANVRIHGGTLAALHDPSNLRHGQIIQRANMDGTGHSKEVRVVFKQRLVADDVVTSKSCTSDGEIPYIEEVLTVSNYAGISFRMNESTVRKFCASYTEMERLAGTNDPGMIVQRVSGMGAAQGAISVAREIFLDFQLAANALVQKMNLNLLNAIESGAGGWVGQATPASQAFPVQNSTDGSVKAGGIFQFKQQYDITGFMGAPIIIGGAGPLHQIWMNDSRYFGQAANGINFGTLRDGTGIAQFYYDENGTAALGAANAAMVFAPGSAVYTPFLQYEGNFGRIANMDRFTMPIPGLPQVKCDVRIQQIACETEYYEVWMECYYDVYTPPLTLFAPGSGDPVVGADPLKNVNGVFKATFTSAV
jgi:hypothetical protein